MQIVFCVVQMVLSIIALGTSAHAEVLPAVVASGLLAGASFGSLVCAIDREMDR